METLEWLGRAAGSLAQNVSVGPLNVYPPLTAEVHFVDGNMYF